MKKLVLSIIFTLLTVSIFSVVTYASNDIEINELNFPDENFRIYVIEKFDKNGDFRLSTEESRQSTLLLSNCNIKDLKGLEYFTSVAELYCSGNELTSLDFSANTNLSFVDCNNNKLKELVVNTKLYGLVCSQNQLESLPLEECSNLTVLYCDENQLTDLYVKSHPNLTVLYCDGNQLTDLNVEGCPNLEVLSCVDNYLTGLNVEENINLKELYCCRNLLTSLDVSNCMSLTKLECYLNQIKDLNLTNNVLLTHLECFENQLSHLDLNAIIGKDKLYASNQEITLTPQRIPDGWIVDFKQLVGQENLDKVEFYETPSWRYNKDLGIAVGVSDGWQWFEYYYHGDNLTEDGMYVMVQLEMRPYDDNGTCVVMKQGAEQAYVNGTIAPTTQYATGYAKMENINGTMQMPLRYIAEVNNLVVVYDENTQKTKVINPVSKEYLLITPGSKTVTKHAADGTLINSSDAPLAFTIQNSVTLGPLRYTCEALGLTVSYQETSHGNYVVVSPESKTSVQAIGKIEEAYQLGL